MSQTLEKLCNTKDGQKFAMSLLEKSELNPKRKLSLWEYGFHKYSIRMSRRNRDDTKENTECVRCGHEIIYGLQIELCRYCYEQSEEDYLKNGKLTRFSGDNTQLIEHEQCELCGSVTPTRGLHKKQHCMKCFRRNL